MALLGEGCKAHAAMQQALPKLVEAVVEAAQDAHPRVRGAALLTLGQMSLDFDELEPDDGSAAAASGLVAVADVVLAIRELHICYQ